MQLGQAGLALSGTARYNIGTVVSAVASFGDPSVTLTVYDKWPGVSITFSSFYRR